MRLAILLAAALVLTGCAAQAVSAVSPTRAVSVSPGESSQIVALLEAAGAASAPSRRDIERALGPADLVRQDGAGAALTYRLPTCALLLLFAADGRNDFRLREANAAARTRGAAAPSLTQCASELAARRS